MNTDAQSPKIMPAAWEREQDEARLKRPDSIIHELGECPGNPALLENNTIDITQDLEALARELCIFAGHDPDASVFPGTPETVRTRYDRAYVIPPQHKLIQAWQLFMPDAIAVRDLKVRGLLG